MSPSGLRAAAAALAALLGACGDATSPPPVSATDLGGAAVARVGATQIAAASVARTARAQGIDARAARDLLVRDALFAEGARARRVDQPAGASALDATFQIDATLARRTLHALLAEAEAQGATTEAELAAETKRHWLEIDRPEGFRTVHAVVMADAKMPAEKRAEAEAIAESIRAKALELPVTPAPPPTKFASSAVPPDDPSEKAFITMANAVPHAGFKLVVEGLPPLSRDLRWLSGQAGSMDEAFAAGATALHARGDVSPVTWSQFGAHVIVLLERTPADQRSEAERRALVRDAVIRERAHNLESALLEKLRPASSIERSADALLATVPVAP